MIEKLEIILKKISRNIHTIIETKDDLGVISGSGGLALFEFYYSNLIKDEYHYDKASEILVNSINMINEGYTYDTFCNGLAGFGWLLDHLEQEKFIEIDNDNISYKFDEYLYSKLTLCTNKNNFDFLQGAIGHGFYFLKRYSNTKSLILREKYKNYILELISFLDKHSIKKNIEIDLGLAHGLASIVNFSARLYYFEDFKDKIGISLKKNIALFLEFKTNKKAPFFADLITNKNPIYNNRLAWCYGDLGI
jgi:hypothetical protein